MVTDSIISIDNLQLFAIIGTQAHERLTPQPLLLNLAFNYDIQMAANSDQLTDTIDYAKLSERLIQFVANSEYFLIEALAAAIMHWLQQEYALERVKLTLKKPNAIASAEHVAITIDQLA